MKKWEAFYRLVHDWQISLTITVASRGPDNVPVIGGSVFPTVVPLDPPVPEETAEPFGFHS